jgi:hypothetical protein
MDISSAGLRLNPVVKRFWVGEKVAKARVHNYTRQTEGCHYFVNAAEEENRVYMTADGDGVRCQDYILLEEATGATRYQVEEVEYYSDRPGMWTALLVKC